MSNNQPMNVTEIASLATSVIALPPFEDGGQEIYVRVKKPDMMGLVKSGKIPNELLGMSIQNLEPEKMAEAMLQDGADSGEALKDALKILDIMMENTLVSPKWHDPVPELDCEFKDILTDEQQNALLAYAGGGMKALATFREGPGQPTETSGNSEGVGGKAEQLPGPAMGSVLPGRSVRVRDERQAAGAGGAKPSGSRTATNKKPGRPKKAQ